MTIEESKKEIQLAIELNALVLGLTSGEECDISMIDNAIKSLQDYRIHISPMRLNIVKEIPRYNFERMKIALNMYRDRDSKKLFSIAYAARNMESGRARHAETIWTVIMDAIINAKSTRHLGSHDCEVIVEHDISGIKVIAIKYSNGISTLVPNEIMYKSAIIAVHPDFDDRTAADVVTSLILTDAYRLLDIYLEAGRNLIRENDMILVPYKKESETVVK